MLKTRLKGHLSQTLETNWWVNRITVAHTGHLENVILHHTFSVNAVHDLRSSCPQQNITRTSGRSAWFISFRVMFVQPPQKKTGTWKYNAKPGNDKNCFVLFVTNFPVGETTNYKDFSCLVMCFFHGLVLKKDVCFWRNAVRGRQWSIMARHYSGVYSSSLLLAFRKLLLPLFRVEECVVSGAMSILERKGWAGLPFSPMKNFS